MTSRAIEELKLKLKRQGQYKKRGNQIPHGVMFTMLATIVFFLTLQRSEVHGIFWVIGILIGVTMQRSKFCFAASFRDPILVGSTSLLKAIIIALIVSTIGFVSIEYSFAGRIENFEGIKYMGQVRAVGLHTVIGAIIFSIGMVIAGGCASGFLMRIGEGFQLQIVVFIGFLIGALLGTKQFEFWNSALVSKSPTIFIPDYLGFPLATIGQILVLIILYFIADWYDKKNSIMSM